jgi:hypothetical protein
MATTEAIKMNKELAKMKEHFKLLLQKPKIETKSCNIV